MIDKVTAALLYAWDFNLIDKQGRIYNIDKLNQNSLIVDENLGYVADLEVSFDQIGTDYHILARPMSDLTKEITIDGESFVPLVELAKAVGIKFKRYEICTTCVDLYLDESFMKPKQGQSGLRKARFWFDTFSKYGFCLSVFGSMIIPKIKHQDGIKKLNEWQYSHDLPVGSWKPLND